MSAARGEVARVFAAVRRAAERLRRAVAGRGGGAHLDVPEHGVRFSCASRPVRKARGVVAVHNARQQFLRRRLVHLLLRRCVVERVVERVAPLARAVLPEVVVILPAVELVAVQDDHHFVVDHSHRVRLALLQVIQRANPHCDINRIDPRDLFHLFLREGRFTVHHHAKFHQSTHKRAQEPVG